MPTLEARLTATEVRSDVVQACVGVVRHQVAKKRGLGGVGIKAALKVVQAVRPKFVDDVVARLLPEFAGALEPQYQRSVQRADADGVGMPQAFRATMRESSGDTADLLLRVTDDRVDGASSPVRKAYSRLRGSAKQHVEAAVPELADVLAKFV